MLATQSVERCQAAVDATQEYEVESKTSCGQIGVSSRLLGPHNEPGQKQHRTGEEIIQTGQLYPLSEQSNPKSALTVFKEVEVEAGRDTVADEQSLMCSGGSHMIASDSLAKSEISDSQNNVIQFLGKKTI